MTLKERDTSRRCPVCNASENEKLFEQRFDGIDGTRLLDGYDVVACRECGAVFADHIPATERFVDYYETASKYEFSHRGGVQHAEEIERVKKLAVWLAGHLKTDCPILDVGCATGELLLQLRQCGFTDTTGMDPSRECVERAQRIHGLRMFQGGFGRGVKASRSYGAVILSAVLEHIPDTASFLEEAGHWLTPEGALVIEVPDVEFFAQSTHAPFQELSVEHVNFFSGGSLANLLGRFGYEVIAERHFMCAAAPNGLSGAVLTVIARAGRVPAQPRHEDISRRAMESYLETCRVALQAEQAIITELVATQEPILVWGTGTLCQRMLAMGGLGQANIRGFIDSNPHYHGKSIAGKPIMAPQQIRSHETILIATWGFHDEIVATIRDELKLPNPVRSLR